ncbi:MAG TPA: glycosyltransferase family 4 protein [Anaerolineales bacterium]|nr:glycosyltransferase family 4 protein [Anaerolineales bacterium]
MKVLYAAYRYDPLDPTMGSSLDFECHKAISDAGFNVTIVGPVTDSVNYLERLEMAGWRLYKKVTGKSGLKFPLLTAFRASRMLDNAVKDHQPDLIFSIFQSFFIFSKTRVPSIWYLDTTFIGQEESWPLYGKFPLALSVWEEKRALKRTSTIISVSEWLQNNLVREYGVEKERVEILPLSAALPQEIIPAEINFEVDKKIGSPLRILFVGRVIKRKGLDLAVDIVSMLNNAGYAAELVICGIKELPYGLPPFIKCVGPYNKNDSQQLMNYIDWYKWANLILHPARFEAGGIVLSEAAAFGTPAVTNDVGGMATTVKDGVSGVVLPRNSPPQAYVDAIIELVSDPPGYYQLCRTTRERFEQELNWKAAGAKLAGIINQVVDGKEQ